jgi:hypothetical protein
MTTAAFLRYIPPGQRRVVRIPLSYRQLELLWHLKQAPATRLELLQLDRPRLALSTPQTVAGLRHKGVEISTQWETATDPNGEYCRFARYALRGKVVHIDGVMQ